jgi:DNA-binding CsgD family transcriptional regulator
MLGSNFNGNDTAKASDCAGIAKEVADALLRSIRDDGGARRPVSNLATLARVCHGSFTYCLIRLPTADIDLLSDMQHKVACLVAAGRSNKEVGSMLGIHPATVASHLGRIFRKLRIESRVDLSRYACFLRDDRPSGAARQKRKTRSRALLCSKILRPRS